MSICHLPGMLSAPCSISTSVEDVVFIVFMRAQEVIVSDPEGQIIVGTVDAVKAVCMAVRGLIEFG